MHTGALIFILAALPREMLLRVPRFVIRRWWCLGTENRSGLQRCLQCLLSEQLSRVDHCFLDIALAQESAQYDSYWSSTGPELTTISTAAATSTHSTDPYYKEATGALWKNNVHDKVHLPATTATTEVLRRSGELWKGREHEEVDLVTGLSRRSGELWHGLEHEEVSASPNL
ncbi:uncharacterized protein BJ212DRAFT_992849 [Suillus subaureus]|uniref:Uncharacterized protein n=1 Tax=Suillus subaureus TaxID=48587 RepID=A0A9P7J550_9AGAM|nr:uncharacterized protein BJ212DRAFT_992849 [Suillus subaureus]KAG1803126.1 hypothetical protein BJ212DRAFT_992849 [Suillus subaureus]